MLKYLSVYEKMKFFKNNKNLIINILICIFIIISLVFIWNYSRTVETDNVRFSNEYKNISTNNKFVYKDIDEILDILNNETGVIYFGFPECIWCQKYVIYLNEVANEENINEIYYFNIKEDRNKNTDNYNKLISVLNDYLIDNDNQKQIYVPNLTIVKNGNIIYNNNETASIDENITPDEYWTKEKVNNFKDALREKFKEIK